MYVIRHLMPKDAGEASGVPPEMQRDWRRRGLMPSEHKGEWGKWTGFDPIEVCALAVMKILRDFGRSLEEAKIIGQSLAPHVAFHLSKRLAGEAGEHFREHYGLEGGHRYLAFGEDGTFEHYSGDISGGWSKNFAPVAIFDLDRIAQLITHRASKPLIFEVGVATGKAVIRSPTGKGKGTAGAATDDEGE
jgi:hypothetical protein